MERDHLCWEWYMLATLILYVVISRLTRVCFFFAEISALLLRETTSSRWLGKEHWAAWQARPACTLTLSPACFFVFIVVFICFLFCSRALTTRQQGDVFHHACVYSHIRAPPFHSCTFTSFPLMTIIIVTQFFFWAVLTPQFLSLVLAYGFDKRHIAKAPLNPCLMSPSLSFLLSFLILLLLQKHPV